MNIADAGISVIVDDSSDFDAHRTITVRKYATNIMFNSDNISKILESNRLKFGMEFGCINNYETENSIHAMFGKIGDVRFTLYNNKSNQIAFNHYLIKNVVKHTMHVDHFCDDDGKLGLIMYGGGKIKNDLIKATYKDFFNGIRCTPIHFEELAVRKLCFEDFVDKLSDIQFDPAADKSFGDLNQAQYVAKRNKINPHADKIQELINNDNIKVQNFKSYISETHRKLSRSYDVIVKINVMGKITMHFPKLHWDDDVDSVDAEKYIYEMAKTIFSEIESPQLFKREQKTKQNSLFDF